MTSEEMRKIWRKAADKYEDKLSGNVGIDGVNWIDCDGLELLIKKISAEYNISVYEICKWALSDAGFSQRQIRFFKRIKYFNRPNK